MKSSIWKTHENCEGSISSTRRIRNSKKPSRTRVRSWKHQWLLLDKARKLRGIYFIDAEDQELKETIQNARKKLGTSMAPAMPCKIIKNNKNCGSGASNQIKSKLAYILEASESTRMRMGEIIADSS